MSARVMLMVRHATRGFVRVQNMPRRNSGREWWLVEADSIDAARKVIEHFEHNGESCVHGRVLANGAKR